MTLPKFYLGISLPIRPFIVGMLSVVILTRLYDFGYAIAKAKLDGYQVIILKK